MLWSIAWSLHAQEAPNPTPTTAPATPELCIYAAATGASIKKDGGREQFELLHELLLEPNQKIFVEGLNEDLTPEKFQTGAGGKVAEAQALFPKGEIPTKFNKLSREQKDFINRQWPPIVLFYLGKIKEVHTFANANCPGPTSCVTKMNGTGLEKVVRKSGQRYAVNRRAKNLLFVEELWQNTFAVDFKKNDKVHHARVGFDSAGQVSSFSIDKITTCP